MKREISDKNYAEFSFEAFLSDDFFIASMNHPTPESVKYWEKFWQSNRNRANFEMAKRSLETIRQSHYTLSKAEIAEIRQSIYQRRGQKYRLFYWSAGVAASIAMLLVFRFLYPGNLDTLPAKPDIAAFAELSRSETKASETHLVLSDEQTLSFDRKETEITYDTTGIVVDREVVAQNKGTGFNQLIVPLGRRSILTLSDGTVVWVNADSRLVYPVSFADDRREIYVDGEIYIEVAEEKGRPFVVRTKEMDVQVLGTKFNVTAYDTDHKKRIVLVSGLVQVTPKDDKPATTLHPDEMYLTENGQIRIEKVDTRKYVSWIDGIYYCENEALGTILQRLSRYYGVEIVCDPSVAGVIFSGKLDLKENLTDIFEGTAFTLPMSFSQEDGKYIISRIKLNF